MDLATFRLRFSEFALAPDEYISSYLASAALECDPDVWGALLPEGIGYLAAHKIAITPNGFQAGFSNKEGMSNYWTHYKLLVRRVAGGPFVIGQVKGGFLAPPRAIVVL